MNRNGHRLKKTWVYLFTAIAIILILAIAAFTAVSLITFRETAFGQNESELKQSCYVISHFLDEEPYRLNPAELQTFFERFTVKKDFRISYIDANGVVIADSNVEPNRLENHARRPEIAAALSGKEKSVIRFSETFNKRMMYYAIPYRNGALRLAVTVEHIELASRHIMLVLLLAAILILALTLPATILVTSRITIPLKNLETTTRLFADGQFDIKFNSDKFPSEFGQFANTLSFMAENLQEKIRALDAQNHETNAILTSMNDGLIMLDGEKRVIRINQAAGKLFGLDNLKACGMPLIQAVRNTDIVDFAMNTASGESELTVELKTAAKGQSRFLLVKSSRIEPNNGQLLVFNDITRIEKLERIRKDFVANVSHELKTPITSIQGFIETLKDGALEDRETANHFLDIMQQQTMRLGAIIDDLLTISHLEQNELHVVPREKTRVAELLENVRNLCDENARKKQTSLAIDCPDDLVCALNPGLFEQAVTNLVLNAIKYSPENAAVSVTARIEPSEKDLSRSAQHLVCTVSDNGFGIPEKHLSRIFERFYRIDKGRSRDQGGTGLGLSIVRHIAIAHGGTVSVKSIEGKGSAFTLDIPV